MRLRFAFGLVILLLATAARADDTALRRCRALSEPAARLACYDALPLAAAALSSPPAAATAPVAAAVVPAAEPAAAFGLQRPEDKITEISSRINGRFEGWRPGHRIRLANGQLWQVSDDSSAVYYLLDPKVTVRRGALGSFMLDIEGARLMPRVRRIE